MSLFLSKVAPQTGIVDIFFRDENRLGRPLRLKRLALEVADNGVKYKSSHGVWILPDRRVLRSLTDAIERRRARLRRRDLPSRRGRVCRSAVRPIRCRAPSRRALHNISLLLARWTQLSRRLMRL